MKRLKNAAVLLLIANGSSAIAGGYSLITDVSGKQMDLDIALLEDTPFSNFLFPGTALILANGLPSLVIAWLVQFRNTYKLIILQSIILISWLLIQVSLLHRINEMYIVFNVLGISLFTIGYILNDNDKSIKHK